MSMLSRSLLSAALIFSIAACGGKKDESKAGPAPTAPTAPAAGEAAPAKAAEGKVPTETAPLALNADGNAIPATVDAPKGSTIFADEPTSLRIEYAKGEDFGIQIKKGNEFNLNLEEFAADLAKNQYGNKNEILEKTETLLRFTMTPEEGGTTTHNFRLIMEVGGEKWVCQEGNWGGWSKEQSDAQIAVCKTLKAL